jgi:hypothetical protein
MHVGRRAGVRVEHHLDHDRVRPAMDWRDRGGYEADALAKARLPTGEWGSGTAFIALELRTTY